MNWRACAIAILLASATSARAAERFEIAAWVDHFDFARFFDTEKTEGLAAILEHVAETGATTILWRNCGGATMRYQSRVESPHHPNIIDKRRIPMNGEPHAWVRYGDVQPDILRTVVKLCKQRGLRPGVHWPYEETHFAGWTIGRWNLEHPQFWARTAFGRPWWGRGSLAYDPVMQHKLALLDELIDRGIEVLFIDYWRTGGWGPAYEYTPPVVESYRRKFGSAPPAHAKDLKWCRHVAKYQTAFLRRVRERLNASGRHIELAVGIPWIAPDPDKPLRMRAADWRAWVREGLIDVLVINFVEWDTRDALGSTRRLYRQVLDFVDGRCKVWCPVQQYNFSRYGLPAYEKATRQSNASLAAALMRMAWEEGAAGVSLECVDYNNYKPATRAALRKLRQTECRTVRPRAAK